MTATVVETIIARLDELAGAWSNQPDGKRSYRSKLNAHDGSNDLRVTPGAWAGWSLIHTRVDELFRLAKALGCLDDLAEPWAEIVARHRSPHAPRLDDAVADTAPRQTVMRLDASS